MAVKLHRKAPKIIVRRTLLPKQVEGKTVFVCADCGTQIIPGSGEPCRCGIMRK